MIRSKFEIPGNCEIRIGQRTPSSISGYDDLQVTITRGDKNTETDFLISKDDKTLARLEKYDLDHNPALTIDIADRPIRGNPMAPVTIVNFDDLECPVCAEMHSILFPGILKHFGGTVRFIYKDNPLVEIHPWALHAAVDGTCLADQDSGAYWSYVDYVHTHGGEVTGETRDIARASSVLDRIATEQGSRAKVDATTLQACLRRQDDTPVRKSMKEAQGLGLNFTPALFVNGEELPGLTSEKDIRDVIDRTLRESGVEPPKEAAPSPPE
ncbi:MAG TPA: thioredoxin domain-containing protein [Terracidiphilus sp.]|jgi:protein-disulfide isomerase